MLGVSLFDFPNAPSSSLLPSPTPPDVSSSSSTAAPLSVTTLSATNQQEQSAKEMEENATFTNGKVDIPVQESGKTSGTSGATSEHSTAVSSQEEHSHDTSSANQSQSLGGGGAKPVAIELSNPGTSSNFGIGARVSRSDGAASSESEDDIANSSESEDRSLSSTSTTTTTNTTSTTTTTTTSTTVTTATQNNIFKKTDKVSQNKEDDNDSKKSKKREGLVTTTGMLSQDDYQFWKAPEINSDGTGFTQKSDIWSIGVVVTELAGLLPSTAPLHPQIVNSFNEYSQNFRDFLSKCLTEDPQQRPTAHELLKHEFLTHVKDSSISQHIKETHLRLKPPPPVPHRAGRPRSMSLDAKIEPLLQKEIQKFTEKYVKSLREEQKNLRAELELVIKENNRLNERLSWVVCEAEKIQTY